jgi:thiol-disulfide isomerase/thioredoxin
MRTTIGGAARVLVALAPTCWALHAQVATITPERPKWGDTLRVSYNPAAPGAQLKLTDPVWATVTFNFEDDSVKRLPSLMRISENGLQSETQVPEGACFFRVSFVTAHDYDAKATVTMLVTKASGEPARNAYRRMMWEHEADADRYFREEIRYYPDNFAAYRNRWFIAGMAGKAEELAVIRADLDKIAGNAQPESLEWLYAMSYVHLRLGDAEHARSELQRMIQKFPKSPLTSDALSYYIFRSSGDAKQEAQQWERDLVTRYPDSVHAAFTITSLAADKSFPFDAVQRVVQAMQRDDPDNPSSYWALAQASLTHQRDYSQAIGGLQTEIGLLLEGKFHIQMDWSGTLTTHRLADAYLLCAEIDLAQGTVSNALADVKAAEIFERSNSTASQLLEARIWSAASDWSRAEAALLEAWRRDPQASEDPLRQAYERVRGSSQGFQSYLDANRSTTAKDGAPAKRLFSFEAVSLDGRHWSLQQLKGKIVALNFWFLGCLPCREEIPTLNQLVAQNPGVVFLAFALDGEAQVGDFLKKFPFNYTIVSNAQKIADGFHVAGYPTHILINPAGEITFQSIGDVESMKAALARAVGTTGLRD